MKFDRYKKEHRKQFTALLLACTIMVTAVAAGLLSSTAVAADLTINLSAANGLATYSHLRAGPPTRYQVETVYPANSIWGAEEKVDIFKVSYENGNQEVTVAGKGGQKVIAPGTGNKYTFAVKNVAGGILDYRLTVLATFKRADGTELTCPVEAKLQGHQGWMLGDADTYRPVLELNGLRESAVLRSNSHAFYTLEWRWPFEQDIDGDGNYDDGNALDTWVATQDQPVALTLELIVDSTYHYGLGPALGGGEEVLEEELPLTGVVPPMLNAVDHYAYLYGFKDGTIRPDADVTRAQVAAIFYRLLREDIRQQYYSEDCPYPDVAEDAWFREEISTLTNAGIFYGYDDGLFRGGQPMTRAELSAVLARLSQTDIIDGRYTGFEDIRGHWAENEIKTIEGFNWIQGYEDGTFRPDANCTRAEIATMINRMLHRTPYYAEDLLSTMKKWPDNADPAKWYYLAMQEASNSHSYERLLGTREKWIAMISNPWQNDYQVERQ